MNSQKKPHGKLAEFFIGKGFYIILFLCVAAIGISGYVMLGAGRDTAEPAAAYTAPNPSTPNGADARSPLTPTAPITPMPTPQPTLRPVTRPADDETEPSVPVMAEIPDEPAGAEAAEAAEPAAAPTQSPPPAPVLAPIFVWPVNGEVILTFSLEELQFNPTMGDWRVHGGIDIAAELGTKVHSITDGVVTDIYDDPGMGTTVVISGQGDLRFVYANLMKQPTVSIGDQVKAGEVIGGVGETALFEGYDTPHLHLEAWRGSKRVDPLTLLPAAA